MLKQYDKNTDCLLLQTNLPKYYINQLFYFELLLLVQPESDLWMSKLHQPKQQPNNQVPNYNAAESFQLM